MLGYQAGNISPLAIPGNLGFLIAFIAVKRFLAVPIAFVFNALSRRFIFVEIFIFLCQMVLQFPLQGGVDEALGYDLHRFVEMSLR